MSRLLVPLVLLASAAIGAGVGVLVSQVIPPETDTAEDAARSEAVEFEGVEGTEGLTADSQSTTEVFTTNSGAMQSIRGIKGIDTVMLQNLEAVLRMQTPPLPPTDGGGGGGGRAAAALLTVESDEPPDPEAEPDGREELNEFDFEGS